MDMIAVCIENLYRDRRVKIFKIQTGCQTRHERWPLHYFSHRTLGGLKLMDFTLTGVGDAYDKNIEKAESKGVKAHFKLDESGILTLDRVSILWIFMHVACLVANPDFVSLSCVRLSLCLRGPSLLKNRKKRRKKKKVPSQVSEGNHGGLVVPHCCEFSTWLHWMNNWWSLHLEEFSIFLYLVL